MSHLILPPDDLMTIVAPDGSVTVTPTVRLSDDEARVFREYKKLKLKYGFREYNRCNTCFESDDRPDGMKGHVTDSEIVLECRCRVLLYRGQSY